jgi:DnaJ-class molecular chaperone
MTLNGLLIGFVAVVALGYFASTYLHPFRPCGTCGGTGVHKGSVYRRASRNCAACGGKGRFRRAGAPATGRAFGEARKR